MSAHTPGPWTVVGSHIHAGEGRASRSLCQVRGGAFLRTPEEEANSNLIAAAPDLLRRLEARQRMCQCEEGDCHVCAEDRAVIKKARGE